MLMESCHGLPEVESACIFYNGASGEPLPIHSASINHIDQFRTNLSYQHTVGDGNASHLRFVMEATSVVL